MSPRWALLSCLWLSPACVMLGYDLQPQLGQDAGLEAGQSAGEPAPFGGNEAGAPTADDASALDASLASLDAGPGLQAEMTPDANRATDMQCDGVADGTTCDDKDPCTQSDACRGGDCAGQQVGCPDGVDACSPLQCNPDSGACEVMALPDEVPCGGALTCHSGRCALTEECETFGDQCESRDCEGAAEPCHFPCQQGVRCRQTCDNDATCIVDCLGADCGTSCSDGASCDIDCADALCSADCTGDGTLCVVDCRRADECHFLQCKEGADCILQCDNAEDCRFWMDDSGCDTQQTYCPQLGVRVCGLSCEEAAEHL